MDDGTGAPGATGRGRPKKAGKGAGTEWATDIADRLVAEHGDRQGPIVCASGISPSGPIHLGNLRELMVPHLVADELRRRGVPSRHLLSWDDYDRLRKVPAGVPASFAEHVGRPLTAVPDPCGEHASWAEHFKAPLQASLARLGVEVDEVSQTQMYRSGAYREQVLTAMARRRDIHQVLSRYRTAAAEVAAAQDTGGAAAEDAEGAGGTTDDAYFPFRPYCAECERDTTTVTLYDEGSTELAYTCACGHAATVVLAENPPGKLVWKVDWPMRWAFEGVDFEAGGNDHSSPGSSFTVGTQVVGPVFGGRAPTYQAYSFVGISGMAKMSGSVGGAPTPADALEVLEAPILRWLYARRKPNQSITVAFDHEIARLYDEWDALSRKLAAGTANEVDAIGAARAAGTAAGLLPVTPRPVGFRTLSSVVDVTAGEESQMLRVLGDLTATEDAGPVQQLDDLRPRLDRAQAWWRTYLPEAERTHVRTAPDGERLDVLEPQQREALAMVVAGLDESWSLSGLSDLLYGVPKRQLGLPVTAPASPELKVAQRELFRLLYQLLVDSDTGPRLPTLLLAVGRDRVRTLLGA